MKRILTAAALLAAISAQASFFTGNDLLDLLGGTEAKRGLAIGYIMGSFDVGDQVVHCVPPGVKPMQLVDIIKKFLIEHPEHRHIPGDAAITGIIAGTFPCVTKSKPAGSSIS